jgi:pilus assembly protein CpaC
VVDLFLSIPTENFSAIIKAMERKNLLTTLAKPNLSAVESEEASFLAGGEFPVPVPQAMGLVSIQWKEFGVKLNFTPAVLDSQMVSIKLITEVSSLDFENGITLSGFRIPALISRKSETTIELKDGEHFAIGGLVSNELAKTVSRVPVLGRLPILGKLFSSTYFLNNESELIVMISPTILDQYKNN